MQIVVALRLVPDIGAEIEFAEDGKSIDREWIDTRLNEFDDQALEEALFLKDATGAQVTAVALAGEGADRLLQSALARGADQALKIAAPSDEPLSSRAAAPLFAAAAQSLGADLILTGVQTPDDIFGQLAPYLGAALDWPQASAVSGVKGDGDGVLVQQELSGGASATLRLALPAVVGVQTASRPIRYISGSKLRQAMAAKIGVIETGLEPAPVKAELTGLALPDTSGGAIMLAGDADAIAGRIFELLVERSVVKG